MLYKIYDQRGFCFMFPNWIQIHVIAEKISKRNCLLVILLVMVILCARFKLSGEICIKFHIFGTLINKKRNTHTHDLTHLPFALPKLLHVMMLKTALIHPGMMCSNLWCN